MKRGFTLIEVAIVVTIVAILLAMISPLLRDRDNLPEYEQAPARLKDCK